MLDQTPILRLALQYVHGRQQRRELTHDTARRQRGILRGFATTYGNRTLRNIARCDVERWLETRHHLRPGSRRYEFGVVRQFCRWLVVERHIPRDPTVAMRAPKVPRSVPRSLSGDETARLAAALPDARARAIFALMQRCGLRRCEVRTLEVGDWDQQTGTLIVRYGKGGHQREVAVPADVAIVLRAYTWRFGAGPMIRRNDQIRGVSNSYLGRLMSEWMTVAGIKVGPFDGRACHSLRHTAASNLVDVEPDLRVTQEFLGHVSLTSTQIYLRRAGLSKQRAALERCGPAA